jgi:hypothetical protein
MVPKYEAEVEPQPEFEVFLSYNSSQRKSTLKIAELLAGADLRPWFDKWQIVPGETWQEALERGLRQSRSCAIFIGPDGLGPWQTEEVRAAIDRQVQSRSRQFRVIPVLLPGAQLPELNPLPDFLKRVEWVEFRSEDDADAIHRLRCGIRGIAPGRGPGSAVLTGECPYLGLSAFDVTDARFFAGRENLTGWLIARIRESVERSRNRFLAISGCSGAGKSSLARAGVSYRLSVGDVPDSAKWPQVICTPGESLFDGLATELLKQPAAVGKLSDAIRLAADLKANPRTLALAARQIADPYVVILLDQFEESFTLCRNQDDRKAFFDAIVHAATEQGGKAIVILTVRTDFEAELSSHAGISALLSENRELVGPMSDAELRRCIEYPARAVGLEFEAGLVDRLLADAGEDAGCLPLLQFALRQLWQERSGDRLTHAAYTNMKGIAGAIGKHADEVFRDLGPNKDLCHKIFLQLLRPVDAARYVRKRVPVSALLELDNPETVHRVLDQLSGQAGRLITIYSEAQTQPDTAEIVHEALVGNWPELQGWLKRDQEFLLWRDWLAVAVKRWQEKGENPAALLRGIFLDEATDKWASRLPELSENERRFIAASQAEREWQRREREREAKEKRRENWKRRLLIVAAVAAVVAVVVVARDNVRAAASRSLAARARALCAARAQKPLPVLVGLQAIAQKPTREAEEALHEAVQYAAGPVIELLNPIESLQFSRDAYLITAAAGSELHLYKNDHAEYEEPGDPLDNGAAITDAAWQPDAKAIATGDVNGTVRIWDLESRTSRIIFEKKGVAATSLEFSHDNAEIAIGFADGVIIIRNIRKESTTHSLNSGKGLNQIAWTTDNKAIGAAFEDGSVLVWTPAEHGPPAKAQLGRAAKAIAFSSDSRTAAIGDLAGYTHLWSVGSAEPSRRLFHGDGGVSAVAFSQNGNFIVTAGYDKLAKLWDAASGREVMTLFGARDAVTHVAFDPLFADAQSPRLMLAARDGSIRLYDLDKSRLQDAARLTIAKFSQEGERITEEDCRLYLRQGCPAWVRQLTGSPRVSGQRSPRHRRQRPS